MLLFPKTLMNTFKYFIWLSGRANETYKWRDRDFWNEWPQNGRCRVFHPTQKTGFILIWSGAAD